jgi:hypothetical protein
VSPIAAIAVVKPRGRVYNGLDAEGAPTNPSRFPPMGRIAHLLLEVFMMPELGNQYNHTWKMFHKMVVDFDDASWLSTGCAYIIPARIAYHIIGGVDYYIQNEQKPELGSGKKNDWNWQHAPIADLPTRSDILELIHVYKAKTDAWLDATDGEERNAKFEWTGEKEISVGLFLLRHMEYHIGELNLLLHISKDGVANDNWIGAFEDIRV